MKKTLREKLARVATLAMIAGCACFGFAADEVTKARFGSLRRDDLVVVDVQGTLNTNAVRELVTEYDRTVIKPREDAIVSGGYEFPVTSVNGKTGDVTLAVADIIGLEQMHQGMVDRTDSIYNMLQESNAYTDYMIDYLLLYATNNCTAASNANARAWALEKWRHDVSGRVLYADDAVSDLKQSPYFTVFNSQLVGTIGSVLSPVLAQYLKAGDVPDWAKENNPPAEADPTVPAWAKAPSKPSYSVSDITGLDTALAGKQGTITASGLLVGDGRGGLSAATKANITALGIPAQDTTYSDATQSDSGLMSAQDKAKLDEVPDLSDYAGVASLARTAVQSLEPATSYTDDSISEFARTNKILANGPYLAATGGVVKTKALRGITVRSTRITTEMVPRYAWIGPYSIGVVGGFTSSGIEFDGTDVYFGMGEDLRWAKVSFPFDPSLVGERDENAGTLDMGTLALRSDIPEVAKGTVVVRNDSVSQLQDKRVQIGADADASGHIENDGSNYNHYQSVAIGNEAKAKAPTSVAIGPWARTGGSSGPSSFGVAIGYRSYAPAQASVAIGSGVYIERKDNAYRDEAGNPQEAYAIASAKGAVQIGPGENSTQDSLKFRGTVLVNSEGKIPAASMAGTVVVSPSQYDGARIAIGTGSSVPGIVPYQDPDGYLMGSTSNSVISHGVAVGNGAKIGRNLSIAVGSGSKSFGGNSVAIGYNAVVRAQANNSIALGPSAVVDFKADNSVQLGGGECTAAGTLQFRGTKIAQGSTASNVKILPGVLPDASTSTKGAVVLDRMWDQSGWANDKAADAGVVSNKMQELRASIPMVQTNRYAMFIIPVDGPGGWPNIELKASTNNFDQTSYGNASYCYLMSSAYGWFDKDPALDDKFNRAMVYATGDPKNEGRDIRAWTRIAGTTDISSYGRTGYWPSSLVIIVSADCLKKHANDPDAPWLHDKNEDLVWSYVRCGSNSGRETEPDSQVEKWHPVMPVKWFSDLPAWANQ